MKTWKTIGFYTFQSSETENIEKPFVLNLDEADDIIETAKKNRTPVFVGYTQPNQSSNFWSEFVC